jgi:hypothetical protein
MSSRAQPNPTPEPARWLFAQVSLVSILLDLPLELSSANPLYISAAVGEPTTGESEKAMSNTFGTDILIQAEDPMKAANFYVKELGFEITEKTPNMISLHGKNINMFIERGPALGPVLEVTVKSVKQAKTNLVKKGCKIVKDEPDFPRCYIQDPHGLIYNITE